MRNHLTTLNKYHSFKTSIEKFVNNELKSHKIHYLAYLIIEFIYSKKFAFPTDISNQLNIGKSYVSKMVGTMKELGLISEVIDKDYRSNKYILTQKGIGIAVNVSRLIETRYARKVRGISAADKTEMDRLLGLFAETLR